ncbi:MAG: ferritin family protein [candidate division WOR-3 bacterium]
MEEGIKILNIGIELEKTGLKNYLDYAFKTKDITGKNMFLKLARDEFDHMTILEKELNSLLTNRCWVREDVPESVIEKVAPRLRDIERKKSEEGLKELDALKSALDGEKKSIEFYKSEKNKLKDGNARLIFERLIEMEESHYDLIQAEIDHIEKTGFWFGIAEFSLEAERE